MRPEFISNPGMDRKCGLSSGLSKVASCQQKSLPTWLVWAGYSAWQFFTDAGCKENLFYSFPFSQAEASILLAQTSFQLAPKTFCSSVIQIPHKTSLARRASQKQNSKIH